jgi:hypothetical protein
MVFILKTCPNWYYARTKFSKGIYILYIASLSPLSVQQETISLLMNVTVWTLNIGALEMCVCL